VSSHCRSDQLNHPDPLNFSKKPDQAGLKGVYTTSSLPLVRLSRSIRELYTKSTRTTGHLHDSCQILTRPDQVAIGYYSSKSQDRFSSASRPLGYSIDTRIFLSGKKWVRSPSDAGQGRPIRPLYHSYRPSQTRTRSLDRA